MEHLVKRSIKPYVAFAAPLSICLSPVRDAGSCFLLYSFHCFSPRIAMETYIRQRQLIMSPLIPSRVIGENEPLTAVFNKVIATREVNHKGQGKKLPQTVCSPVISEGCFKLTLLFLREINNV